MQTNSEKIALDSESPTARSEPTSGIQVAEETKWLPKLILIPLSIIVAIAMIGGALSTVNDYLNAEQSLLDKYIDKYTAATIVICLWTLTSAIAIYGSFQDRDTRSSVFKLFFAAFSLSAWVLIGFSLSASYKSQGGSLEKALMWCIIILVATWLFRVLHILFTWNTECSDSGVAMEPDSCIKITSQHLDEV